MILTIAPKLFGGRLCLNCALTIPELPAKAIAVSDCTSFLAAMWHGLLLLTMRPRHLAPDYPYLRSSYLFLAPVDVCDALAEVELGRLGVVHAFDLDEGGVGVGVPLD